MQIARVHAVARRRDPDEPENHLVLLCGIDHGGRLLEGEWMGYAKVGSWVDPFVLNSNGNCTFDYGSSGGVVVPDTTNLPRKKIGPGELFTVMVPPRDGAPSEEWTYEILTCHPYT